ncbi:MAG TPA: hypothetical protein PKO36_07685 [Candidatus Hydrogenedentes bacterium]|nr:hypothetical protein [Candidatus Hydrogenedentota bacterium]HOT49947.1 hypothetical protein [Candidatus Hydrogenedentota bacterium]HOV73699.1 hypothetical protein [Candidatus Hydrogenedentota bacterium]HPC16256.1 hypothetical protein [Candidatus Hydrogenedentota bacterium]HRT21638.1 hypothetical protein [Candidatus Hydrogenedentota bacterium]
MVLEILEPWAYSIYDYDYDYEDGREQEHDTVGDLRILGDLT